MLYLSAVGDDKHAAAQETPEGHAVRLDPQGRITHLTAINAKWSLERDGELVSTLRDGRRLRVVEEEDSLGQTLKALRATACTTARCGQAERGRRGDHVLSRREHEGSPTASRGPRQRGEPSRSSSG